jgi:hypothetical protein
MRLSSSHLARSQEMFEELRHRDSRERVSQCESEPRHQADICVSVIDRSRSGAICAEFRWSRFCRRLDDICYWRAPTERALPPPGEDSTRPPSHRRLASSMRCVWFNFPVDYQITQKSCMWVNLAENHADNVVEHARGRLTILRSRARPSGGSTP